MTWRTTFLPPPPPHTDYTEELSHQVIMEGHQWPGVMSELMTTPPPARRMTSTPLSSVGMVGSQRGGAKGKLFKPSNVMPDKGKKNGSKECQYLKGGVCMTHGPGAKLKHKPVMTVTKGVDGKTKREMKRHYYYDCNVAPAWQIGMAKYLKPSIKSGGTVCDETRGKEGGSSAGKTNFSLSTTTVGQPKTSEDKECSR